MRRLLIPAMLALLSRGEAPVSNSDAAMVNAAMLSFFTPSGWNHGWSEGDLVVISESWATNSSSDFADMVSDVWGRASSPRDKRIYAELDEIPSGGAKSAQIPLTRLDLDSRILRLANIYPPEGYAGMGWSPGERVKGTFGERRTVRIKGALVPPVYSPDGRYAALRMTHVPWSIHACDITFFFQKQGTAWTLLLILPIYYL
ncbi:hypothetical protein EON81_17265 [bacterium]|nr:MAG: hypothetical protein EON81_17265 [bacterium]